jgi:hypothetical protein
MIGKKVRAVKVFDEQGYRLRSRKEEKEAREAFRRWQHAMRLSAKMGRRYDLD